MTQSLQMIGFDADDTLWHNAAFFRLTQDRFTQLLGDHADPADLEARLLAAERRNIGHYGYGVKGFTLSLIETALEVTENRVPGAVIAELIDAGRALLDHPMELLPHAADTVAVLAQSHRLVLITKGDLLHQERKLAQSGLGDWFHGIEIVSEKTPATYARILTRFGVTGDAAMMVGDSMKSDVLPMLENGGYGVHVPHAGDAWVLEQADAPKGHDRFHGLTSLADLSGLVMRIEGMSP